MKSHCQKYSGDNIITRNLGIPVATVMGCLQVRCAVDENHLCVEESIDCSIGEVLLKASKQSVWKVRGIVWHSITPLTLHHRFADYCEPEAIQRVAIG
jgi:hypothetical protein